MWFTHVYNDRQVFPANAVPCDLYIWDVFRMCVRMWLYLIGFPISGVLVYILVIVDHSKQPVMHKL